MVVELIEQRWDDIYRVQGIRKPAAGTTTFSYKGRDYTIDLTDANDKDFDDAILPFLEAATEVTGRRKGGSVKKSTPPAASAAPKKKAAVKSSGTPTEADAIREWARSQGIQVSDRGRIADSVKASYYAGHPKPGVSIASLEAKSVSAELEPEVEETQVEGDYFYDDDPYDQI